MKTALAPALSSSPKVAAHGPDGGSGQQADTALGFLAELAAAIGAVGPLGQPMAVPTLQSGSTPASGASTATALPGTLPGAAATALLGNATAAISPVRGAGITSAATADAPTPAVTSTGIGSLGTDATTPLPAGTPLPQVAVTTAMPVEVTASKPESPSTHHAKAAATDSADSPDAAAATSGQATPSTPAPTDGALTTDSAAAGIDPLSAAAASTTAVSGAASATASTAVPSNDGAQQTTAVLRQVFPDVTRVSTTPGTHRLAITLHPDDLGEVRVTVAVRGDSVRVNVATDPTSGVARTALEHGAPELRRLLEATGASARVDFRDLGAGTGASLGSATDGGRQQSQSFGQAQSQAHAQPQGQSGGGHRQHAGQPPGQTPGQTPQLATSSPATARATVAQTPTVRTAASGLDQLI